MSKPEERLQRILKKAEKAGIQKKQYEKLDLNMNLEKNTVFIHFFRNKRYRLCILFVLVVGLLWDKMDLRIFNNSKCIIEMPRDASKIFREPEYCYICEKITSVDKIENISSINFLQNYHKFSKPLVVKDGALNWPALKEFNFNFFKNLYDKVEINHSKRKNCQFFPYKTEFRSLDEVFQMSEARARLEPGEADWYVGWNNCNDDGGKILQRYYEKPYFLSDNYENIALSWIFMGGPGHGAHMHVDNVQYPSWQAQLSGRKEWILAPPPECYYKCKEMRVIVEPGEIIVLDTNRWYHQTNVLPGNISITVGSEFD